MDELMVKDNGISNDLDDAKNNILVKIQGTLLGAGVAGIYQQKADGSTVMAVLPEKDSTVEPMRIGDRRYHSDGLVGFFMDGVFHQEVCEARDFLAGNQIQTKLNEKNEMILLMDIGLNTTVTTGILPKKEVKTYAGDQYN